MCFAEIVPDRVPRTNTIDVYFAPREKKTLSFVVAKMVALDGLTFRVFETSDELRESLKARGFKIPKTAKSYKQMVIKFSKEVRRKQNSELQELVLKGERFCLTFDEWTSLRNRRYLNLILHGRDSKIWNLGLVRIRRKATSERLLSLVEKRLKKFNINVDNHIICVMTDGCPTMTKIGKLCPTLQQLCYAHGIQLAVIDVLYAKDKTSAAKDKENQSDSDSDDDGAGYEDEDEGQYEDDEELDNEGELDESADEDDDKSDGEYDDKSDDYDEENCAELSQDFKPLINKVRTIVKMFKRSPKKNEILQRYVKPDFKHEMVLLLDTKTRWSSLAKMLRRFYDLRNCIKKSLVDINPKISIEESDFELVSDIVSSLEPIQAAVEALCRRDANLITADATLIFTLKTISCFK